MTIQQLGTGLGLLAALEGGLLAGEGIDGWHVKPFGWVLIWLMIATLVAACVLEFAKRKGR